MPSHYVDDASDVACNRQSLNEHESTPEWPVSFLPARGIDATDTPYRKERDMLAAIGGIGLIGIIVVVLIVLAVLYFARRA